MSKIHLGLNPPLLNSLVCFALHKNNNVLCNNPCMHTVSYFCFTLMFVCEMFYIFYWLSMNHYQTPHMEIPLFKRCLFNSLLSFPQTGHYVIALDHLVANQTLVWYVAAVWDVMDQEQSMPRLVWSHSDGLFWLQTRAEPPFSSCFKGFHSAFDYPLPG